MKSGVRKNGSISARNNEKNMFNTEISVGCTLPHIIIIYNSTLGLKILLVAYSVMYRYNCCCRVPCTRKTQDNVSPRTVVDVGVVLSTTETV